MDADEIRHWLLEKDPEKLQTLWTEADSVRRKNVGGDVFLRGLIEISNICRRNCLYCGIRAGNAKPERYRMSAPEIVDTAKLAKRLGYGTVVIQSGEDYGIAAEEISRTIESIKRETGLAVTLSLGERDESDYRQWYDAGANRYLLRFETSNPKLFNAIHPPLSRYSGVPRLEILRELRTIGYEIGSGVMSGIPGQTWDDLARDIELFGELDLDMIGCGPFLPHPETPLGQLFETDPATGLYRPGPPTEAQKKFFGENGLSVPDPKDQVVCDENLPFKVIALARLMCPAANIPSTTAIATIDPKHGRLLGLSRGANVVMPNLTPMKYRKMYEIYPNKAASFESPEQTHETAVRQILELDRTIGQGHGTSIKFFERAVDDMMDALIAEDQTRREQPQIRSENPSKLLTCGVVRQWPITSVKVVHRMKEVIEHYCNPPGDRTGLIEFVDALFEIAVNCSRLSLVPSDNNEFIVTFNRYHRFVFPVIKSALLRSICARVAFFCHEEYGTEFHPYGDNVSVPLARNQHGETVYYHISFTNTMQRIEIVFQRNS